MFYVYELVDPRDQSVFYVGKGKGSRRFDHEADARRGVSGEKCDRIRAIIEAGGRPIARIVATFDEEQSAYDAEAERVEYYGLENLTNIIPGGGRYVERPRDPVREARNEVRKSHKLIRRCLLAHFSGMTVTWSAPSGQTVDFVQLAKGAADSLRKWAGPEFFDRCVWGNWVEVVA